MLHDPPLILGKYHSLQYLGAGAYGHVVRATDEASAQYAIKFERASKKKRRPPSEHEANVLRILADAHISPRIPRLIDYGYDKPSHSKALVLELLGADIQSMRKQCGGRLSIKTTLLLALQLIPTIRYIHSKGFVHRDIKPGNILLGTNVSEDNVYIVDFGIARRYTNPRHGAHMAFLDGKPLVGTVRYASLNTHLGIAQTRRDDIECLAYSLLDCLRDLPWGHIKGGSPKQFEERVREKKRSWSPEKLCVGIPDAFKELLSHARQLKFDEEPDYDGLQKAIIDDIKRHGCSVTTPFDWSEAGDTQDFVPPITRQPRSLPVMTESTNKLLDSIQPGDFIKLKLLGSPTIQFSGRFNSVATDPSLWRPPSLATEHWESPYRPAIVTSVQHRVIVRKGRQGIKLSVYPLMRRKESLNKFPEQIRNRFIPLATLGIDSRIPHDKDGILANVYIYNTCVTLAVSVDPHLISNAKPLSICWRLNCPLELKKVTEQLQLVRPPPEGEQSILPEDGDETIEIKKSKRRILQTVLADIGPLTPNDAESQDVVWSGRNGWLKEYNQIARRRNREHRDSGDEESSEEYDSDYIYDGISPPGERRKSCTVSDFE